MFNPLDPYNVGGLWAEVNKLNQQVCEPDKWLKEHIFNPDWGIWHRIATLEHRAGEQGEHCGHLNEQIHNPDWGLWSRVGRLEKENAELKEEVRKLRELATQLSQLENMLINAVNQQLGCR